MSATAGDYRAGVGILLLNPAGLAFVGKRVDYAGDAWQMPQGGIDPGETPRQAAFRELKEEVGTDNAEIIAESVRWYRYELPRSLSGRLWRGRYRGQQQKWFAMRFRGRDSEIDIATARPEFSAWKWVDPAELPRLIVPFKRQVYLEVLKEFAPHLRRG